MDSRTPSNGAAVVARYWTDPAFAKALIADGSEATRDMGFDIGPMKLIALPNTPDVHNVVVCTLCSCYPWSVLGLPPAWYKSPPYRSKAVIDPRGVLSDFGMDLSDDVAVVVHDSTAETRYLVLPIRPDGADNLGENELANLVTRNSMIGTGLPEAPA